MTIVQTAAPLVCGFGARFLASRLFRDQVSFKAAAICSVVDFGARMLLVEALTRYAPKRQWFFANREIIIESSSLYNWVATIVGFLAGYQVSKSAGYPVPMVIAAKLLGAEELGWRIATFAFKPKQPRNVI